MAKKKKSIKHKVVSSASALYGHFRSQIGFYISVLTIAGMLFGTPYFLDARYAKADDLKTSDARLEQKILSDKFGAIESHIWSIQEHFKNLDKAPQEVKDEIRDLQSRKDRIKNRLDVLDKQLGVSP